MESSAPTTKVNGKLITFAFVIFAAIAAGLVWLFVLAPSEQSGAGWYLFSFATGLTMIVLPCTLPLAFVIVPLSMGKGVRKGLGIALSFGLAITLSLYGVAAAIVGKTAIGSLGAPLETIKNWVYFVAGIFAYLFALGEVGLVKLRMPSYTGAAPAFIQKQGDFLKALMLGLFLGNIGVGCPHPATPLLLIEIASSGNIFYGWTLFLVHAIGRILPLLLLAILGIAGINGLSWLIARKDKIEKATGWAMVFVAGFILILGLFTHDWWVNSGIHTQLEKITQEETLLNILGAKLGTGNSHHHGIEDGTGLFGLPLALGNWVLVILWLIPLWWWWARERKRNRAIPETETVPKKEAQQKVLGAKKWGFIALSVLLALTFIYVLPTNFMHQTMMMTTEHGGHGETHEESTVKEGLVVKSTHVPETIQVNSPAVLRFSVLDLPPKSDVGDYAPIYVDDLEIEHEKYMHVIGMRDDLTNFFHIHPAKVSPGVWEVPGMFREAGNYKIWSDVKQAGVIHSFGHTPFNVSDASGVPGPALKAVPDFSTTYSSGAYRVVLKTDGVLSSKAPGNVGFDIFDQSGNPISLDNFLGAQMHLAVIKDDLSVYVHTHPSDASHDDAGHMHSIVPFVKTAHADAGHDMSTPHGMADVATFSAQVPFQVSFP